MNIGFIFIKLIYTYKYMYIICVYSFLHLLYVHDNIFYTYIQLLIHNFIVNIQNTRPFNYHICIKIPVMLFGMEPELLLNSKKNMICKYKKLNSLIYLFLISKCDQVLLSKIPLAILQFLSPTYRKLPSYFLSSDS